LHSRIDIDQLREKPIKQFAQWPSGRSVHGQLCMV